MMKIFRKVIGIIVCVAGLMVYVAYNQNPSTSITNEPLHTHQSLVFAHTPALPSHIPEGLQVAKSLLGLEVTFLNRNVNYPGLAITSDPRYQALTMKEKLVDAIRFQSTTMPPFLLLIAIAKTSNGSPIIVPGKFDIVTKTEQDGFVLKDTYGRLFYYSGYILATPAWKGLAPGQVLQDKFCKELVPMAMCPVKNTVTVILKKFPDPSKNIPLLAFVQ
jgi:hypothetical protein